MAVINRILEDRAVPAHQEVGVVRETSRVACGKDVSTLTPVVVTADGNDHLVEDGDGVNRVSRRTRATVVVVDRVGHVRLVVGTVQVNTIPALGKEDLVTDTVLAFVDIGEVDVLAFSVGRVVGSGATIVYIIVGTVMFT